MAIPPWPGKYLHPWESGAFKNSIFNSRERLGTVGLWTAIIRNGHVHHVKWWYLREWDQIWWPPSWQLLTQDAADLKFFWMTLADNLTEADLGTTLHIVLRVRLMVGRRQGRRSSTVEPHWRLCGPHARSGAHGSVSDKIMCCHCVTFHAVEKRKGDEVQQLQWLSA